jgi:hypothetical protein
MRIPCRFRVLLSCATGATTRAWAWSCSRSGMPTRTASTTAPATATTSRQLAAPTVTRSATISSTTTVTARSTRNASDRHGHPAVATKVVSRRHCCWGCWPASSCGARLSPQRSSYRSWGRARALAARPRRCPVLLPEDVVPCCGYTPRDGGLRRAREIRPRSVARRGVRRSSSRAFAHVRVHRSSGGADAHTL